MSFFVVMAIIAGASGCAAAPALVTGGAATANYCIASATKKTFTASLDEVREASAVALKKMGFDPLREKGKSERIYTMNKELKIIVFLKPLTGKSVFVRVNVYRNEMFFADHATGMEVIHQMGKCLVEK